MEISLICRISIVPICATIHVISVYWSFVTLQWCQRYLSPFSLSLPYCLFPIIVLLAFFAQKNGTRRPERIFSDDPWVDYTECPTPADGVSQHTASFVHKLWCYRRARSWLRKYDRAVKYHGLRTTARVQKFKAQAEATVRALQARKETSLSTEFGAQKFIESFRDRLLEHCVEDRNFFAVYNNLVEMSTAATQDAPPSEEYNTLFSVVASKCHQESLWFILALLNVEPQRALAELLNAALRSFSLYAAEVLACISSNIIAYSVPFWKSVYPMKYCFVFFLSIIGCKIIFRRPFPKKNHSPSSTFFLFFKR